MGYRLLVLDIDGTVTNSGKMVTRKTKEAVWRLQEKGVFVAIASGRPTAGIAPVAEELGFEEFGSFVLAFNGARIVNWKTKECIYSKTLPLGMPRRLYRDAVKHQVGIITYEEAGIVAGTCPDVYMETESRITGLPITFRPDFQSYVNFPVNKCLFTGEPEELERIEPLLAQEYLHEAQIFRSEPFFLEATPKNVDKAYCLARLLKILGIDREEMVCCGDGYNDISMIQYAGLGVAMANAQAKVKDVADYITVRNNDEDGVAEVIEKFFLQTGKGE